PELAALDAPAVGVRIGGVDGRLKGSRSAMEERVFRIDEAEQSAAGVVAAYLAGHEPRRPRVAAVEMMIADGGLGLHEVIRATEQPRVVPVPHFGPDLLFVRRGEDTGVEEVRSRGRLGLGLELGLPVFWIGVLKIHGEMKNLPALFREKRDVCDAC